MTMLSPHGFRRPFPPMRPAPVRKSLAAGRRAETLPVGERADLAPRPAAEFVRALVWQLAVLALGEPRFRRDTRRMTAETRQVAIYLCHTALALPLSTVGAAFGRSGDAVDYICNRIEDRRDDRDFDAFLTMVERLVAIVFHGEEVHNHG